MNSAIIKGRLVKDVELNKSKESQKEVCSFTVAVDRRFQKKGEEKQADFIRCVSWEKQAVFIANYFKKGQEILIRGTLQTRAWTDKEGIKRNTTELLVDEVEFCGAKSQQGYDATPEPKQTVGGGEGPDDESLPFDL